MEPFRTGTNPLGPQIRSERRFNRVARVHLFERFVPELRPKLDYNLNLNSSSSPSSSRIEMEFESARMLSRFWARLPRGSPAIKSRWRQQRHHTNGL